MLPVIWLFVAGLAIGSFVSAYSYRAPLGVAVRKGRSYCPSCKNSIHWYDNIPLISFLVLGGKCRSCSKSISARYPLIELATGLIFASAYLFQSSIEANLVWSGLLGSFVLVYLLFVAAIMVAVFVIDLEHELILDELVFLGLSSIIAVLLLSGSPLLVSSLMGGFLSALFLLFIHLATRGRGMGLGDVKLALFVGTFFGLPLALIWLFGAFILGGIVGIVLLALRRAGVKDKVPFGPFLVLSFFFTLVCGSRILEFLFLPSI